MWGFRLTAGYLVLIPIAAVSVIGVYGARRNQRDGPPRRPPLAVHQASWFVALGAALLSSIPVFLGLSGNANSSIQSPVVAAAIYGIATAVPLVLALMLLRRWISFGTIVTALVLLGLAAGSGLRQSSSSTAVFGLFGPVAIGLPLVIAVTLIGSAVEWDRVPPAVPRREPHQ